MAQVDSVLLCGFGGPTPGCCGRRAQCDQSCDGFEAECFVAKILGDDPRQQSRVDEVSAHYKHFGGYSPYNQRTEAQRAALQDELANRGHTIRVEVGYRNWTPWYSDGWQALKGAGCNNTLLTVLAPHQGKRSWDDYLDEATAAQQALDGAPAIAGATEALYAHPKFIAALVARIQEQWADSSVDPATDALLLTAHAIPQPAERGAYRPQVEQTAALVAAAAQEHLGITAWGLGFQSAPDESRIPWSQPVMEDVMDDLVAKGAKRIVVLPIGFLVDHMEVLYDLDEDLLAHAKGHGIDMLRATTVEDHPLFIAALADSIEEKL